MFAVRQLFFIHEPEWARERFRESDAAGSQPLGQSVSEEFQHIAAPGKPSSIFRLFAGGKQFSLAFSKVVLDGTAQMFRSKRSVMTHARDLGICGKTIVVR